MGTNTTNNIRMDNKSKTFKKAITTSTILCNDYTQKSRTNITKGSNRQEQRGKKERPSGLTFVALSRLRKLTDILIQPMTLQRLQSISKSKQILTRINEEERLQDLHNKVKENFNVVMF